jgi:hypothetical protein
VGGTAVATMRTCEMKSKEPETFSPLMDGRLKGSVYILYIIIIVYYKVRVAGRRSHNTTHITTCYNNIIIYNMRRHVQTHTHTHKRDIRDAIEICRHYIIIYYIVFIL